MVSAQTADMTAHSRAKDTAYFFILVPYFISLAFLYDSNLELLIIHFSVVWQTKNTFNIALQDLFLLYD